MIICDCDSDNNGKYGQVNDSLPLSARLLQYVTASLQWESGCTILQL